MLARVRRKLSRSASVSQAIDGKIQEEITPHHWQTAPHKALTLTLSDEQLVSKLSSTEDTEFIQHAPKHNATSVGTAVWSDRTVFNNVDSGFLSLPTELLLFLQPYLALSSEVALRHSCSRFFHLYKTQSWNLSGKELFEFLCTIERDQDPAELDRLVCAKCQEVHIKSSFPSSEIKRPAPVRDCRQIWLCPHRYLGYAKTIKSIKAGAEAPFRAENIEPCSRCRNSIRNRSISDRPEKGTSLIDLESPKSASLLISKVALLQVPSPLYNIRARGNGSGMYRQVFPGKDVSMALQEINFALCPHLKLGDPYILSKFCRACINTQKLPPGVKGPPCISEYKREFGETSSTKCKGTCYVRGCRTQFMFQARESLAADASGRRQIWLIIAVYRWLGPLLTEGRDSTWSEHAVDHKERKEMRENWARWEKSTREGRACMPNWSICLLHPDDSNLR